MRIYLTSMEETKNIEEINKKINEIFINDTYSIKVVPCRYEKHGEEIKEWHKKFYQDNRERLIKEQRERRQKQKLKKQQER